MSSVSISEAVVPSKTHAPSTPLYNSFKDLERYEMRGVDYEIVSCKRASDILVAAPHAGLIEPGTFELAALIAGAEFSLYSFLALSRPEQARRLHVTSVKFDEPTLEEITKSAALIIAIHGLAESTERIFIGGRNQVLRQRLNCQLQLNGYQAHLEHPQHNGLDQRNLCNRGISGEGLQLEIGARLRDKIMTKSDGEPERLASLLRALLLG